MANTTNFGWETPDDTDLVKDGASAMRTLGNSIDASFVDLKGGTTGQVLSKASNTDLDFSWTTSSGIQATLLDAKGDLIAASAADTAARLAVGSNGQYLSANSATATGLEWVTPASGGMTLLSTTSLSSDTTTISSISQNYTHLQFYVYDVDISGQAGICFQNASASGIYYSFVRQGVAGQGSARSNVYLIGSGDQSTSANSADFVINLYNYTSTKNKALDWRGRFINFSDGSTYSIHGGGITESTSAISSVSFLLTGGPTFQAGTVLTYGIK